MAEEVTREAIEAAARAIESHPPHTPAELLAECALLAASQSRPTKGAAPSASGLDEWIEREFRGHGRALQTRDEPPLEGEPWMSMADAKELTRRAVAEFSPSASGRGMVAEGWQLVPKMPTEEMLIGARDWSIKKNGLGVGNDQATGCYQAMLASAPAPSPDNGWLSIESAPREKNNHGDPVDIWVRNRKSGREWREVGCHLGSNNCWVNAKGQWFTGKHYYDKDIQDDVYDPTCTDANSIIATHWMRPLPPPSAQGGGE